MSLFRFAGHFFRKLWLLAAILVIVYALITVAGRELLPVINHYQPQINAFLSDKIGLEFQTKQINGRWNPLRPMITAKGVSILSKDGKTTAIAIDSLSAELSLIKTLSGLNPVWQELTIGTVTISAIEDADGNWALGGFQMQGGKNTDLALLIDMLFDSRFLRINQIKLDIKFYSGTVATLYAQDIQIENAEGFHRLTTHLALDDPDAGSAQIILEGNGDPRDPEHFDGKGFLKLSRINFDTSLNTIVKRWFPQQVEKIGEIDTEIDLNFWFDWKNNQLINGRGTVSAAEIPLNWVTDAPSLTNLNADIIGWYDHGESWGIRLQQLHSNWGDETIEPLNFQLSQQVGNRWGKLALAISQLDLEVLNHLLHKTGLLNENLDTLFTTLNPKGRLRNIVADFNFSDEKPNFTLRANLDDISQDPWEGAPASRGVNGYIEASISSGFVELNSPEGFAMHYPQAYNDFMLYGAITGRIDWHLLPEQSLVIVNSGPITIDGKEGQAKAYLNLRLPTKVNAGEPEMTLMVSMRNSHSRYLPYYLPKVLSPALRNWLDNAVGEGDIPEAGFIWRGSLRKANSAGRTVQVYARINNGNLNYQPRWPALSKLDATLVVDNKKMDAWVNTALVGEAIVEQAHGALRASDDGLLLSITGDVSSPANYALHVLKESPIAGRLEGISDWVLTGDSRINLALAIPMTKGTGGQKYNINTAIHNGTLSLPGTSMEIKNIKGKVNFSLNKGLYSKKLEAIFLDNPIFASIQTHSNHTNIDLKSSVEASTLTPYLAQFSPYLTGQSNITGRLTIPFQNKTSKAPPALPSLNLTSNLQGLAIDLPKPFTKPAEDSRAFNAHLQFDPKLMTITGSVENSATAMWELVDGQFTRGQLSLLSTPAALPERKGLLISGTLPALDWAQWQSILSNDKAPTGENAPNVTSETISAPVSSQLDSIRPYLDLLFDELIVSDFSLGKTALTGDQNQQGYWSLSLTSTLLGGLITVPTGDNDKLQLQLDYLHLPEVTEEKQKGDDWLDNLSPMDIPAVEFSVTDLMLGDEALGSLSFVSTQRGNGILFDKIRGNIKGIGLGVEKREIKTQSNDEDTIGNTHENNLQLTWLNGDNFNHSYVSGTLTFQDLGKTLKQWEMPNVIGSENAALHVDLGWEGKPWKISTAAFEGYLGIDLANGHFYKATGTATNTFFRMVSLFNFDTWMRRLRFDFSDLFSEGVSFDSVKGGMAFNQGIITFEDPIVATMPSGKMHLLGSADINKELLDARIVATMPVGTNLPWLAGLLGGLPAVAGVYLTGKIFEKQVNQLSSISYKVTGPWDDPKIEVNKIFSDKTDITPQGVH